MILCTNKRLSKLWRYVLDTYKPHTSSERFRAMPRPMQVFYLVFWWDCELQNGGMGQFILNYSGDCYLETIDALLAIGSVRSAMEMTFVQDVLGTTLSPDHTTRHNQLEGITDISELDSASDLASDRVQKLFGDRNFEEDELNLLAYVETNRLDDALNERTDS
jgi:Domain of unknown function (DUF4375)